MLNGSAWHLVPLPDGVQTVLIRVYCPAGFDCGAVHHLAVGPKADLLLALVYGDLWHLSIIAMSLTIGLILLMVFTVARGQIRKGFISLGLFAIVNGGFVLAHSSAMPSAG